MDWRVQCPRAVESSLPLGNVGQEQVLFRSGNAETGHD